MDTNIKNKAVAGGAIVGALAIAASFVAPMEGLRLTAYKDVGGVPTICNGITKGVELGQTKTDAECKELLDNELGDTIKFVDKQVKIPLSDWQRAGLSSFVYNVGEGNFLRSSILKQLNQNHVQAACDDLINWVYVDGKDCRISSNNCGGIVKRREGERELCLHQ